MTEENETGDTQRRARPRGLMPLYSLAAILAAMIGFLSVILFDRLNGPLRQAADVQERAAAAQTETQAYASAGLQNLVRAATPKPIPDFTFADGDGAERRLSDWRGKVVLINLWATWCAPCKIEMPSLNRLQAELGGEDFTVLPVSLDFGGPDKPRQFLESNDLGQLGLYLDGSSRLIQQFGAPGLPFTALIDREGREIARLAGPAEWDSDEALALIREAIAAGS